MTADRANDGSPPCIVRDLFGAVDSVLNRLEASVEVDESRYFGLHSLPLNEWYAGMDLARSWLVDRNWCWSGTESFLDVGCGTGTKMALASALGWGRVAGVELRPQYVGVCRELWPEFPVTACDAFDFDAYGDFDLVYSYRLCVDLDDQRRLTAHIVSQMKPGALLFLAGGPDPTGLRQVGGSVWEV